MVESRELLFLVILKKLVSLYVLFLSVSLLFIPVSEIEMTQNESKDTC